MLGGARRREVLVDDLDLLQAGAAAGGDERVAKRVRGEGGRADGGGEDGATAERGLGGAAQRLDHGGRELGGRVERREHLYGRGVAMGERWAMGARRAPR